jgi:outer membrane protein TolC
MVTASGVAAAQPAPATQPPAPALAELALEDAIHLALTRNERAEVADLNIVVADAGVTRARVAFMPVVNLSASDTVKPFDNGARNAAQAQLTVTQPVIAPSAYPLYEEAKQALEAELAQARDDKRRLAFDAAKAYFVVQQADSVLEASKHKLDTAQNDLTDTSAQYKAQLVSSNDVTRAQVVLAGAQRDLAGSQAQLDAAWLALEFLCNENIPRKLANATSLVALAQQPVGDLAALINTGRKNRPDLVAHQHSAVAAHEFAKEPRYRFFPTLSVSATGLATTQASSTGHELDMSLQANLGWAIWDGGARDADARSRDAQAAIADLSTNTLVRQIDNDIRTAAAQVTGAQNALVAANASADASRQSATETAILYHQGLAKAIELLDANDERFEAEVAAASAVASLANAYLALRLALGEDPLPASTSGGKP